MLYGWMKSLVLYLVLSGLVLNFAPNANYKRYIRFFSGLMVLLILAEPIQSVFHLGSGDLSGFVSQMEFDMERSPVADSCDSMYNYFEMGLAESIRILLQGENIAAEKAETLTDGQGTLVKVTVVLKRSESASEDEIKKLISDVYNLDVSRIYIVRR